MSRRPQSRVSRGPLVGFGLVLVALAVALADSVYLLISHIQHKRGGQIAGLCDISVSFNCRGAIESAWSTLLGVPVPVWAIAFYATMFLAALRLGPPREAPPRAGWSLISLGFVFGLLYSLFLLYLLIFEIRVVCPGCLVLDASNLLGLVGAFLVVGRGVGGSLRWMVGHVKPVALGAPGMAFATGFALIFLVGALVTREELTATESTEPVPPDQAYNIVEGFPDIQRVELPDLPEAPSEGSPDAPVVLVEFSDFECPFCKRYSGVIAQLVEEMPELVQIRFMNYPLNSDCNENLSARGHVNACRAARAAVCAQDQGRFWEMHDLLFDNNTHLDHDSILEMAQSLRLDPDEFQACWESDYSLDRVRSQAAVGAELAREAGATSLGTPFSFVNGLLVRGARRPNELEALVRREATPEGTGDAASDGASVANP